MSKAAVVFYSGSGNTEAMADVIVNALGADKIEAEAFGAAKAADYDAIAFGCPAMGDEVLEETIFQPMWDDVKGFIENGGRNCLSCGCWKVYSNECAALQAFARFEKCKAVYQRLFASGCPLSKLTVAGRTA